MNFDEYQHEAARTNNADLNPEQQLSMCSLGLGGEAGEFLELVKKYLYHGHELNRTKAVKELGDVLWYLSQSAKALGIPLGEVAEANIAKLRARYPKGFSSAASVTRAADDE